MKQWYFIYKPDDGEFVIPALERVKLEDHELETSRWLHNETLSQNKN